MASNRNPRSIDLYCGIGGLTLGLERAGVKSLGGIDIWEDAVRTFEHNLKPLKCLHGDMTKVSTEEILSFFKTSRSELDMLSGGPPCQGFSTVGKRDHGDPRNQLWKSYLELVEDIRPAYVLIENVEGLVVMKGGRVRDGIVTAFGQIGYRMKCKVLRSCDFGVPQLRKRVIFLGWLQGLAEPSFPKTLSHRPVTVGDAIFDLPPLSPGEAKTEYDSKPQTDFQKIRRNGAKLLLNHEAANHPEHLVKILKHIPDGGNRKSIPDELQPKSGFHNSYARLASDKPAVAVTSNMRKPSSARATHPLQHRGLTVREGMRLQTFDDTFEILGSRTSQYLQVGNAVPPLLAEAVGYELVRAYRKNSAQEITDARSRCPEPVF
jgi:DNA (cytosine-5)-methyltransferase 1